jgi:hypothetical protein
VPVAKVSSELRVNIENGIVAGIFYSFLAAGLSPYNNTSPTRETE